MRRFIALTGILFMVFAVASIGAQTQGEEETPPQFVEDLAALLEGGNFSGEEVAQLVTAAEDLDWEEGDAESADPAVVALALEVTAGDGEESDEMEPGEQAQLALQLAQTAVEMENEGYQERVVARAAIEGARQVRSEVQAWKQEGGAENLGDRIRNTVRERVVTEARNQVEAKGFSRADEARDSTPGRSSGSDEAPSSDTPGPGRP